MSWLKERWKKYDTDPKVNYVMAGRGGSDDRQYKEDVRKGAEDEQMKDDKEVQR